LMAPATSSHHVPWVANSSATRATAVPAFSRSVPATWMIVQRILRTLSSGGSVWRSGCCLLMNGVEQEFDGEIATLAPTRAGVVSTRRSHQHQPSVAVRESADDPGSSADLAHNAFQRVVGSDLLPVSAGEAYACARYSPCCNVSTSSKNGIAGTTVRRCVLATSTRSATTSG
jgi:hypothetical protein